MADSLSDERQFVLLLPGDFQSTHDSASALISRCRAYFTHRRSFRNSTRMRVYVLHRDLTIQIAFLSFIGRGMSMQPKRPQKIDADDQIRDYYEHGSPSENEAFPEPMESIPTAAQRAGKLHWPDESIARLSGGDPDASPQGIDAGTETPGDPTPHQIRI